MYWASTRPANIRALRMPTMQAAAPELQDGGGDDRQRVERREVAGHAAAQHHDRRHDERVGRQLHVHQPPVVLGVTQGQRVERGEGVGEADQVEERIDGERARIVDLDQNGRAEQQGDGRGARRDQPQQLPSNRHCHGDVSALRSAEPPGTPPGARRSRSSTPLRAPELAGGRDPFAPRRSARSASVTTSALIPRSFRGHSVKPCYVSLLMRSKIGRYIAMTMPPTMMPRNAIMIGSSSVSSPATAVSTSSS